MGWARCDSAARAKFLASRVAAVTVPRKVRRSMLGSPFRTAQMVLRGASQYLIAHILEHVGGALDTHFAGQNRVLILDAENALIAYVHIGAHDFFPGIRAVSVAHRSKGFRGLGKVSGLEGKVQNAVLGHIILKHDGVFHVSVKEAALLAQQADHLDRVAALPKQMTEIVVGANLFAYSLAELQQRH